MEDVSKSDTPSFLLHGQENQSRPVLLTSYRISPCKILTFLVFMADSILKFLTLYEKIQMPTFNIRLMNKFFSFIFGLLSNSNSSNCKIVYRSDSKCAARGNLEDWGAEMISHEFENGLGVIKFSDKIEQIPGSAFNSSWTLRSITLPNSITSIGNWAFHGCYDLKSITIPNSVSSIGEYAFMDCWSMTSVAIGNNVISIGEAAFGKCSRLKSITIPNNVSSIGKYAFWDCGNLKSITIPNSVILIGEAAFGHCKCLEVLNGKYASSDNRCLVVDGVLNSFAPSGLTSYAIPDGVTSIGKSAFNGCSGLTNITIPNSVTSIGANAFENCNSLIEIYCKSTTPPKGDSCMFRSNALDCKIYVPRNSVDAYKSAEHWCDYADYIVGYDF